MVPPSVVVEEVAHHPWVQGIRGAAGELPSSPLYRTRCCQWSTALPFLTAPRSPSSVPPDALLSADEVSVAGGAGEGAGATMATTLAPGVSRCTAAAPARAAAAMAAAQGAQTVLCRRTPGSRHASARLPPASQHLPHAIWCNRVLCAKMPCGCVPLDVHLLSA